MIEREFIRQKAKYLKIREYIETQISKSAGAGKIIIEKTPMGEKIMISAVRPGLIIGRGGKNISDLTEVLKKKFKLENPQIEVQEVVNPFLSSATVAKKIAANLERFGPSRFKAVGYGALQNILKSGAIGAEIRISGRGIPGQKAKSWRFYGGYMKKCGDIAVSGIDSAQSRANLRSGTVGIKVSIMPPDIELPDKVIVKEIPAEPSVEEVPAKIPKVEKKEEKPKKKVTRKKKATTRKKKVEKKVEEKKAQPESKDSAAQTKEE